MSYINPLATNRAASKTVGRLNYPGTYKETIHVTKYERDTVIKGRDLGGNSRATTSA